MGFTLEQITGKKKQPVETITEVETEGDLSFADKARLTLQGLTLNYGDEGLGYIRSLLDRAAGGELTYDEAVKEERDILERTRKDFPGQSLAYEIGGAIVPSIGAMVFTGGLGTPAVAANIGRIATQLGLGQGIKSVGKTVLKGAGEGLVAGTGAAEGDVVDRLTDTKALTGGVTGAVAAPAVQGVIKGVGAAGKKLFNLDVLRKNVGDFLGKAETDEFIRVINETGLEPEEIIRRVGEGEILADMTPEAAMALRALYNTAGKGRGAISEVLTERATTLPARASETLQETLSPSEKTGNILKWFGKSQKDLKKEEGDAYNAIFDAARREVSEEGAVAYNDLNRAVVDLLQQQKKLRPEINALFQAAKQPPLFKVVKGEVELLRDVDLETAEILRRALADQTQSAFQGGKGKLGAAIGDLEKDLRKTIDGLSPELATTRANWSAIMSARDAFDAGQKIMAKSADEVEIIFEELVAKGDQEAIAAFRAGYASALRNKKTLGSQVTLFRDLNDVSKKHRMILETIFPGDNLDDAVQKINLADGALKTANRVLGGSPTAPQQATAKKIGTASNLANITEVVTTASPFAAIRLLRDLVGTKMDNLSQEQRTEVAKMLVSEDAEMLERILTDKSLFAKLANKYDQIVNALAKGTSRGAIATTATDIQRGESRALNTVIKSLTPTTRKKLDQIGK